MSASDPASPEYSRATTDRFIADAARAADGARVRLGGVLNDLFRPPTARLNDRDHAVMTRMLSGLIDEIEHLLFPDRVTGTAWQKLAHSRVLRDPELAGLLLRRSDEHHLVHGLRALFPQARRGAGSGMDTLARHDDPIISELASALLIAESRRIDRFGEPLLLAAELPADLFHRFSWWIASAMRDTIEGDEKDRVLGEAVKTALGFLGKEESAAQAARTLARHLMRQGGIADRLIADLFREGRLGFAVASLAARANVPAPLIWVMFSDPDAARLTILLKAIDMDRTAALGLIADLLVARGGHGSEGDGRLSDAVEVFDTLTHDEAGLLIRPWQAPL
jgi:hypothetical protein